MRFLPIALLCLCSCSLDIPDTGRPHIVRADTLAESYLLDPAEAHHAYTGHEIVCLTRSYSVVDPKTIVWHVGDKQHPPVVVFHFTDAIPPPTGSIWIRGMCRGPIRDGGRRELPFGFHVRVDGCAIVQAPTR